MKLTKTLVGGLSLLWLLAGCSLPGLPGANQAQPMATTVAPVATVTPVVAPTAALTATLTVTMPATTTQVTTTAVTTTTVITNSGPVLVPTPTVAAAGATTATATVTDTAAVVPPADAASERLSVPAGFAVRLFAEGLGEPRLMTFGPDGLLYVADQDGGRVLRLPDANGDGLADEVEIIAADLPGAHSVEWFDEWLYVAEHGQIERLQDTDGDGTFETKELVTDNIPGTGGHSSRTLHFGPDGLLYVAAGSSSNNDPESDPRRAAILRFNPDGSIPADNPYADDSDERRQAVWAEGLRNSVDFLFLADGRLWADHNGSDGLGDEVPPEEIVIEVNGGNHYGWPYCYTPILGAVPAQIAEVRDERVDLNPDVLPDCSMAVPALFTDWAHAAPLGITQYNGTAFPADYQGNLFVAYHGSWNSTQTRDCRVQMIVVQDGAPVASQPFLTGFRDNESQQCGNAWGRPAGVMVGPDGALFVSDDQNGNLYRVVYTGGVE